MNTNHGVVKSKLFKLKEWLTLPETARYLSSLFDEEVSEADVLRLALDGHLKVSVNLVNGAYVRLGKVVTYEEAEWVDSSLAGFLEAGGQYPDEIKGNRQKMMEYVDRFPPKKCMKSLNIAGERYLNLSDKVFLIRDVWDLPMIGGERLDIEHKYQMLTDGPAITSTSIDGAFVEGDESVMCQLQEDYDDNQYRSGSTAQLEDIKRFIAENNIGEEHASKLLDMHKKKREEFLEKRKKNKHKDNYYPAGGLPSDSVLVVRTKALLDLQGKLSFEDSPQEKPLGTRERENLLKTIIAMAVGGYGYDIEAKKSNTPQEIVDDLAVIGVSLDVDTVRKYLKQASEIIPRKQTP